MVVEKVHQLPGWLSFFFDICWCVSPSELKSTVSERNVLSPLAGQGAGGVCVCASGRGPERTEQWETDGRRLLVRGKVRRPDERGTGDG